MDDDVDKGGVGYDSCSCDAIAFSPASGLSCDRGGGSSCDKSAGGVGEFGAVKRPCALLVDVDVVVESAGGGGGCAAIESCEMSARVCDDDDDPEMEGEKEGAAASAEVQVVTGNWKVAEERMEEGK